MRKLLSLIAFFALWTVAAAAADVDDAPDVLDMNLDQNINYPEVPRKAKTYVTTAMDQLRRMLNKSGFEASLTRDGEVVDPRIFLRFLQK